MFDKYYANLDEIKQAKKSHADYVLKIVGFNDCVDGSEIMLEHEFLMKGKERRKERCSFFFSKKNANRCVFG